MPSPLHERKVKDEVAKYPYALPKGTRLPKSFCPDKKKNKKHCVPDGIVYDRGRWYRLEVNCKGRHGPCKIVRRRISSPLRIAQP